MSLSIRVKNPDFRASDPAEMSFIPRADQDSASQTTCGRCGGDVILWNHHSALGQLGKDVGMMFCGFRSERLDPHHAAQGFESRHAAESAKRTPANASAQTTVGCNSPQVARRDPLAGESSVIGWSFLVRRKCSPLCFTHAR
jgi:hypothetical protein